MILGRVLAVDRDLGSLSEDLQVSLARPGVPPHLAEAGRYVAEVLGGVRASLDEASSQLIGDLEEALIEQQIRQARRRGSRSPAPPPKPEGGRSFAAWRSAGWHRVAARRRGSRGEAGCPVRRTASISSYERRRLVPSLRMLHRLLAALGYPLSALERAQGFLDELASLAAGGAGEEATPEVGLLEINLRREIEALAQARGHLETRRARLELFLLAGRQGAGAPVAPGRAVAAQPAAGAVVEPDGGRPPEPEPAASVGQLQRDKPGRERWNVMS